MRSTETSTSWPPCPPLQSSRGLQQPDTRTHLSLQHWWSALGTSCLCFSQVGLDVTFGFGTHMSNPHSINNQAHIRLLLHLAARKHTRTASVLSYLIKLDFFVIHSIFYFSNRSYKVTPSGHARSKDEIKTNTDLNSPSKYVSISSSTCKTYCL